MSGSDSIEVEAGTVDEAVANALASLGAAEREVEVEVLESGSRGLFGIGSRLARVRVTRRRAEGDGGPSRPAPARQREAIANGGSAALENARMLLADLLARMGFESSIEVGQSEDGALLEIHSTHSSVVIGKHGQTLDALEYVLNLIVSKEEESASRIHLDCEQYRVKRKRSLEEMAQRMADQVKKRGRPVTLDPLSPRDRRTIHLALQSEAELTTRSTGEGFYRQLMILPKGDPKRGRPREH